MPSKRLTFILVGLFLITTMILTSCKKPSESTGKKTGEAPTKRFLKFTGGPSGGTFQFFSNGISVYLSKHIPNLKVSNQASQGSTENLRKVNSGRADFGIVYSGDVFLARNGKLAGDPKTYKNVRAIAFLYKAPAQLAVLKKSGIKKVSDLNGKRVDIGGPGSGAAASAERYLKTIGLWDKIRRSNLGYSNAASAIKDGHIDAMWVLAGYPTAAIINLSSIHDIELLNLGEPGLKAGLDKKHPYYKFSKIPANTYRGVAHETSSFFDSSLWVAGAHVSEEDVYNALKQIFTPEGLKYLATVKSTAKQMSVEGGITGIVTPLHKGAEKFWKENGLTIPPEAVAE